MKGTALLFLPLLLQGQTAPKPANQYVGSEVCKTCHADVWLNFHRNPHYKSIASGKGRGLRRDARDATGPAPIMSPPGEAKQPSVLSPTSPPGKRSIPVSAVMRKTFRRPTSGVHRIPKRTSFVPIATPSTRPQRRSSCSQRCRRTFATPATLPSARSSKCLPNTA